MATISLKIPQGKLGDIPYRPENELAIYDPTPGDDTLTVQDQQIIAAPQEKNLSSICESVENFVKNINAARVKALRNRADAFVSNLQVFLDEGCVDVKFSPEEVAASVLFMLSDESQNDFTDSLNIIGPKTYHAQILSAIAQSREGAILAGKMIARLDDAEEVLGQILSKIDDDILAARVLVWTDAAMKTGLDISRVFDPKIWKDQRRVDRIASFAVNTAVEPVDSHRDRREIAAMRDDILLMVNRYHNWLSSGNRAHAQESLRKNITDLPDVKTVEMDFAKDGYISYIYVELHDAGFEEELVWPVKLDGYDAINRGPAKLQDFDTVPDFLDEETDGLEISDASAGYLFQALTPSKTSKKSDTISISSTYFISPRPKDEEDSEEWTFIPRSTAINILGEF